MTQIDQLMQPGGIIPVNAETTAALARELAQCRAALAMRNSDVQTLVAALTRTVKFYDKLDVEHRPGEARLLDEMYAILVAVVHK